MKESNNKTEGSRTRGIWNLVSLQEKDCPTFSVASFNILADQYSTQNSFPETNPSFLQWNYRKDLLLGEILSISADLWSLQEVDHFDFFEKALKEHGYEGIFYKKNHDLAFDGCCVFYKSNKFKLEEYEKIPFGEGHNQVVIQCKFLWKELQKQFCFISTHLKASKGFESQRLIQGHILLNQMVNRFSSNGKIPFIIAGDFNETPDSNLYKFFKNGQLLEEDMKHPFSLQSAYKVYDSSGIEPLTTLKKRDQVIERTSDYLWYSLPFFKLVALLEIPPKEKFPELLPCASYASDHIAIAAKFCLEET